MAPVAHPLGLVLPGGDRAEAPSPGEVSELVGGDAADGAVAVRALSPVTELSGERVELGWPGALPVPVLQGPVATYADVTPGVDLQVQATSVGFETFMVLAERPAPGEDISWSLPVTVQGATPVERSDGSVEFVSTGAVEGGTPAGEVVSVLPAAYAWDAQADAAAEVPTNYSAVDLQVTTLADGSSAVTVTPDRDWLQDPATVFPVTVDPSYASGMLTASADTYVQSNVANTPYGGSTELRLGTYNGGGAVARSFLSFDSTQLAGKDIRDARLELYATHSYSCQVRGWEVWSAGAFSEATTVWGNQPAMYNRYALVNPTYGYSSGCASQWVKVPVTGLVGEWAAQPVGTKSLGIKAEDEADSFGWKKFASRETAAYSPKIFFYYNQAPAAPPAPTVAGIVKYTPPGETVAGNWTADRTPTLSTATTDPNGNTVKYEIQLHSSTTPTAATLKASCMTGYVASGASASCTMPAVGDDAAYYARARAIDDLGAGSAWSAWSGFWGFTVTSTVPALPTVSCPGYVDGSWTATVPAADVSCTITGAGSGASTPGWIHHRVDGADPSSRVLITPSSWTSISYTTVTLPATEGTHTIRARTDSRSGVVSAPVDFSVGWGGDNPDPGSGERSFFTFTDFALTDRARLRVNAASGNALYSVGDVRSRAWARTWPSAGTTTPAPAAPLVGSGRAGAVTWAVT